MTSVILASVLGGLVAPGEHEQHGFLRHFDLARRPEFRSVGHFRIGPRASGVWIYDDYVLTLGEAAFDESGKLRQPVDCEFVLADGDGAEHAFRGKSWIVPNILRETIGTKALSANVAVLRLDRKVSIPGAGPAILGFGRPGAGETVTMVGFGHRGLTGSGADVAKYGSGSSDEPSRGMAFLSRVGKDTLEETLLARPDPGAELHGVASYGDEGGGVFGYQRGEWRLVGLVGQAKADHTSTAFVSIASHTRPVLKGVVQGQWADFLGVSGTLPGPM